MTVLRSFARIINAATVLVSILSIVSTYLCLRYGVYIEFPLTLIGIAVVFPIVFSIGGAFSRREAALQHYAHVKAHGRSMYLLVRDFSSTRDEAHLNELKDILAQLLLSTRGFLNQPLEKTADLEDVIYSSYSSLSMYLKECRDRGIPDGDGSRLNQYLSKMLEGFENLKHIHQYRTPVTLRAYSKVFIFVLPIIYGPFFAFLAHEVNMLWAFVTPVLLSVILVALDNIQDHMENPFDLIGEDDVRINVEKFMETLDD